MGLVVLAQLRFGERLGLHELEGIDGDVLDGGLLGNGVVGLVGVVELLQLRGLRLVGSRALFGGQEDVLDCPVLIEEVEAVAGLHGIGPDAAHGKGHHLLGKQVAAQIFLKLRRRHALPGEDVLVELRVELAGLVAEGGHGLHVVAQLQRGDGEVVLLGLLDHQLLVKEAAEHAPAEIPLLLGAPAPAGILAVLLLLGLAVGHFELLKGDGLVVHHGHDVDGSRVGEAAYAPEHEDQNDDAEGQLDAEGLGVGTDLVEHDFPV